MEMKASKTSLIGMIVGAVFLSALAISILIKFLTDPKFLIPTMAEAGALIMISCSPAVPFCPVFISMLFDKIKEIKELKIKKVEGETANETK